MIISHKYKFIFIKTVKTAGTSIEVFLSQYCGEEDVVTPIWPHVEQHHARNYQGIWYPFAEIMGNRGGGLRAIISNALQKNKFFNHIHATEVRHRVPTEVWNTYFKFCVERNPWDKTLSHYHMVNDRASGDISFEEYIEKGKFCINYPMYTDTKGLILVDKVIKYESLMGELGHVFEKLGIPFEGSLGVREKTEHRKDRRPYQEVYTAEQKEVIKKAFAKEIELHGYVF